MQPNLENTSRHSPAGQSPALVCGDLFGGRAADQQNALHNALILAAADYATTIPEDAKRGTDTKSGIYQFVEETPATSMVVELVAALNKLGWRIVPAKSSPNDRDVPTSGTNGGNNP